MKKIRYVTYKARDELVGPRPWEEVRSEIISGALPRWTPLRFEDEGVWTDFEIVEKKKAGRNSFAVGKRGAIAALVFLNVVVLAVGFFHHGMFFISGGLFLSLAVIIHYFETFSQGPEKTLPSLVGKIIPCGELAFPSDENTPPTADRSTRLIVLVLFIEGLGYLSLFVHFAHPALH